MPQAARDAFVVESSSHIAGKKTVHLVLKAPQIPKRIVTINSHSSTTSWLHNEFVSSRVRLFEHGGIIISERSRVKSTETRQTARKSAGKVLVRLETEESFDRGKEAGGLILGDLSGLLRAGLEAGAALGNRPTDGFGEVGIRFEQVLHRGVADFQDFGFLQRHHTRGSRFAGEERHLSEERAFAEHCYRESFSAIRHLDLDAAIVDHKHGRALVARANHQFPRSENMA